METMDMPWDLLQMCHIISEIYIPYCEDPLSNWWSSATPLYSPRDWSLPIAFFWVTTCYPNNQTWIWSRKQWTEVIHRTHLCIHFMRKLHNRGNIVLVGYYNIARNFRGWFLIDPISKAPNNLDNVKNGKSVGMTPSQANSISGPFY